MSATTASRTLLRRPNLRFVRQTKVRYNSTTEKASEAASNASSKAKETAADASSKAKESASNFQSKASEGLSKVTSSAGVYAKSAGNALGKIGGRTGKVIKAVECEYTLSIDCQDERSALILMREGSMPICCRGWSSICIHSAHR